MFARDITCLIFLVKKHDHLLLCELLASMGRHLSLVDFSSPWLWMVGLQGSWQARCSLSAVLQLGYLTKARTCMQAEYCSLAHKFFIPRTSVACASLPHTAISLLPPSLSPSVWVTLSGALGSEPIGLREFAQQCNPWGATDSLSPPGIIPCTSTGNCTPQVSMANSKCRLYLDVLLAHLHSHTASWVHASLSQAGLHVNAWSAVTAC